MLAEMGTILHAQKAAQGVVCNLRLAAHVPLDHQPRVKAEYAGSRRAAEVLQTALIQLHPDVVVDLVGVDAVVALRQVVFQLQGVGILFHKVAVGVPLAELANADVHFILFPPAPPASPMAAPHYPHMHQPTQMRTCTTVSYTHLEKLWKKIKKCQTLNDYKSIVRMAFDAF